MREHCGVMRENKIAQIPKTGSLRFQVRDAQHRSRLSNELMMYHILVPDEEVHQLVTMIGNDHVPKPRDRFHQSFETFSGVPRGIPDKDTPLVSCG